MKSLEHRLQNALAKRESNHLLRALKHWPEGNVDFFSNDYLGLAKITTESEFRNGSGGSRLISGNHSTHQDLEKYLASFHQAEAALLFNSGFDANLALFSTLPQKGDVILYDTLVHSSIRQGIRLSNASSYKFWHNDLDHLAQLLDRYKASQIFIAVESIYSMDGDKCALQKITELAQVYEAEIILDEAHSNGVEGIEGEGMAVNEGLHNHVFARMMGFGKAIGRHGAVVLGSQVLMDYLVNFATPFIYSTALPPSAVAHVLEAYQILANEPERRGKLKQNIQYFQQKSKSLQQVKSSDSPIQTINIPGNEQVKRKAKELNENGINISAILSPTVPQGSERLRVCLHSFNSKEEIDLLLSLI